MNYKIIRKNFMYSVFLIIGILSYIHPFYPDDYFYSLVYGTNKRIANLKDIIISGKNMYLNWSGRVISNFLQNFFMFIGKEIFSLFNAIMFLGIIYFGIKIIYKLAGNHEADEKDKFWDSFLLFSFIWFFIPGFSEDFIWLVGSSNYGWMLFILEIFILEFLNVDEAKNNINIFILAFLTGLTNESSVVFANVFVIVYMLRNFKDKKRVNIKKIKIWICLLLSSCISMFSIGNFRRFFIESKFVLPNNRVMFPKDSIILKIMYIFSLKELQILIILLLFSIIIGKFILKINIKKELIVAYSFILTHFLMILIMPRNEKRAILVPVYFMILFFLIIIKKISEKMNNTLIKKGTIFSVIIFLFFSISKVLSFYLVEIKDVEQRRKELINYYIATNSKEAIFEHYGSHEKNLYNHKIFDYIWKNPEGLGNKDFSIYYNFEKTYAIQKENELLIIKFKDDSNINNIKIHFKSPSYDLDASIDKSTMDSEKTLYVEIPEDTYEIDINGSQFEILNIRILKIIKGEIYNQNGNIRNIKL